MELFYFSSPEELDSFIKSAADTRGAEFLQSWQWGEILKVEGAEIKHIGVHVAETETQGNDKKREDYNKPEGDNKKEILAAATLVKKSLRGGYAYWYSPRGPIFRTGLAAEKKREVENFLFTEIKNLDSQAIFLRVEPTEVPEESKGRFKIKKTLDLQPKQTLILDLDFSEEDLLKAMHQKTRYNINLTSKKEIEIKEGEAADFSEFWRLLNLTGTRDNFRLHDAKHYQNLLNRQEIESKIIEKNNDTAKTDSAGFIKLFLAQYQGHNIAAGLFCFWGDKVTYMHGASDNEFRNLMAPYLLQWSLIKKAKKDGYKYYDFYGVDETKWPGVTRFKLGFGGRTEDYPGTYDIVFQSGLYGFYELTRKLRRLIK